MISFVSFAQKTEFGILYSPYLISKITFDKDYLIFEDCSSVSTLNNRQSKFFTILSTGIFFKYKIRNKYFQTELNFFEYKFKTITKNYQFSYNNIQIPLIIGFTPNPGRMLKFRIYGGFNNNIGKFSTGYLTTYKSFLTDIEYENFLVTSDKSRKEEMMSKFSSYYINIIGGIGISHYGTSLDFRMEKNITNLNKVHYDYNANFKSFFICRFILSFRLTNVKKQKLS